MVALKEPYIGRVLGVLNGIHPLPSEPSLLVFGESAVSNRSMGSLKRLWRDVRVRQETVTSDSSQFGPRLVMLYESNSGQLTRSVAIREYPQTPHEIDNAEAWQR